MAEEYLEAKDLVSKIEYTTPGFISNPGDRVIKRTLRHYEQCQEE